VPAYGPQNDVTLKMPAFEWVHVQLHQQKGMISLSPPTICNSAEWVHVQLHQQKGMISLSPPTICNSALFATVPIRFTGEWHCCKVSDEAAFCLIQRPYISKTLLTRRISPRGSP
ncbi:hypothetical protein, partial [Salmonella enterica]|uniref:hypothetical protein n=1 Tax=Salmonella enterica TaxID=28901 RepID=UPI003CC91B8F